MLNALLIAVCARSLADNGLLVIVLIMLIVDTLVAPVGIFYFLQKNKTRIQANEPDFCFRWGILYAPCEPFR